MPFVKGQSGNPGGRARVVLADGTSVKDLARKYTAKAVQRLAEILDDNEAGPTAIIAAANSLLDRGWGRPVQAIGDEDGNALDWVLLLQAAQRRLEPPMLTITAPSIQ